MPTPAYRLLPILSLPALLILGACGSMSEVGAKVGLLGHRGLEVTGQEALVVDGRTLPPTRLTGRFAEAFYSHADENTVTFVLIDRRAGAVADPRQAPSGPVAEPLGSNYSETPELAFEDQTPPAQSSAPPPIDPRAIAQAAVIRMFWSPRAGTTPIEAEATNATVHYVIFPHDADDTGAGTGGAPQVGVYTGAGFLMPGAKPGGNKLSAEVWDASLRLEDATPAFLDLLGRAELDGSFTARRDDARVELLLRDLRRMATDRLGYPRGL